MGDFPYCEEGCRGHSHPSVGGHKHSRTVHFVSVERTAGSAIAGLSESSTWVRSLPSVGIVFCVSVILSGGKMAAPVVLICISLMMSGTFS